MDIHDFALALRRRAAAPHVTHVIVAINVAAFVLTSLAGGTWLGADNSVLIRFGANLAPLVTGGEPWRLLTAGFLHAGIIHIGFNMLVLLQGGRIVERLYGHAGFALLYLAALVCGSVASLWWRQDVVSVGASGAVFGVYGGLAAYLVVQRASVPAGLVQSLRSNTATFVVYALSFGLLMPGVDNAAHLGGLFGGALASAALAQPLSGTALRLASPRSLGGLALLAALCAALYSAVPDVSEAYRRHAQLDRTLEELRHEERRLIGNYQGLMRDLRGKRLDAAAGVARLRHDLIPGWKRQRDLLDSVTFPDEAGERRRSLLIRYVEARREAAHAAGRGHGEPQRPTAGGVERGPAESGRGRPGVARAGMSAVSILRG